MLVTLVPNVTLVRLVQSVNAWSPMVATPVAYRDAGQVCALREGPDPRCW